MIDLRQGDCMEKMKDIPDGSIDLTVTSPPYDNLREYNGNNALWGEHVWKAVIKDLYRVTKQGGVVVWVVADATIKGSETGTSFKQALWAKDCGFNLHDTMIWIKEQLAFPDINRYYNAFEYMFVFSKGKPNVTNLIKDKINRSSGTRVQGKERKADGSFRKKSQCGKIIDKYGVRWNYWLMYNLKRGIETQHPAIFPEKLANDHIISWSNEGDTVLDPFMGSGTTGKMAVLNNRNFIGIELDGEYIKIANERIAFAQKKQSKGEHK